MATLFGISACVQIGTPNACQRKRRMRDASRPTSIPDGGFDYSRVGVCHAACLIPKVIGTRIPAGTPEYALFGFAAYSASCLLVKWWFYGRKNAEIPC